MSHVRSLGFATRTGLPTTTPAGLAGRGAAVGLSPPEARLTTTAVASPATAAMSAAMAIPRRCERTPDACSGAAAPVATLRSVRTTVDEPATRETAAPRSPAD